MTDNARRLARSPLVPVGALLGLVAALLVVDQVRGPRPCGGRSDDAGRPLRPYLPEPTRTVIALRGERGVTIVRVDACASAFVPVAELSMLHLVGGRILATSRRAPVGDRASGEVLALPLDGPRTWSRVAEADATVPSAAPGRLWLVRFGPPAASVREVDLTGRQTTPPSTLPERNQGAGPVAAVPLGLLIGFPVLYPDGPWGLELWDPRSGRIVRRFGPPEDNPDLIAASGDLVVWGCRPAKPSCGPRITNLRSGRDIVLSHGPDVDLCCGALSPDRRKLVLIGHDEDGTGELYLADIRTGAMTRIAGSRGPSGPVWSSSGKWIFFGRTPRRADLKTRVGAYRIGSARALTLRGTFDGFRDLVAS